MRGPTPLFLFVILFIQVLMSWLAFRLLIRFRVLGSNRFLRVGYWLIALISIFILYSGRLLRLPADFLQGGYSALVGVAYAWTISQFIFVVLGAICLASSWLLRKTAGRAKKEQAADDTMSRRDFLQATAAVVPLAAIGTGAGGVFTAMNEMAVNRYPLQLDIPAHLEGFKIAQLSDLHVGPFFSLRKLERVIDLVRKEKPDLLVITGDFIDELELAEAAVEKMSQFAAEIPQGIYFCWGNHEYFKDKNRIEALLKKSAIQLLDNSNKLIVDGKRPFYLVGVDYPWADKKTEQVEKRKQFLAAALKGLPDNALPLLISHHPDFIEEAFAAGIPLTLTGHTHGGQVSVFGYSLLPVQYRYMRGMYQRGDQYGYVHTGTGHWLPFRIGCPPEICVFTLNRRNR